MANHRRAGPSRQTVLERTLRALVREGSFRGVVVASIDGLPLAMAGRSADKELMAGVAAWLKEFAERTHTSLDEIIARDAQSRLLVCRYFNVGDDQLLLAVSVPPHRAHRRLTNKAIREIQRIWEG
jgi:predicted regulator of Ras-like GTPase activity (Roadblock/LC7/MglB family)